MALDPNLQQMLAGLAQTANPSLTADTPERARKALVMLTVKLRNPETVVAVAGVEDLTLPGATSVLPARVYRPGTSGPVPTILFLHGGGFVIGDIDTHDNQCRTLCRNVGAVVLSVGYRLAPEAPFPAAVEDCVAALAWTAAHAHSLGGDASRLVIAGDSAGGNLAAVTARLARDAGGPPLAAQLLLYPAVDFREDDGRYPSRAENAEGYFLTREDMEWFSRHYIAGADPADPRLSPILAVDLDGVAPAVVATAEYDPLRDEGEAYAHALESAGVAVSATRYDGLIHGFFDLAAVSPSAAAAVDEVCANLRRLLDPGGRSLASAELCESLGNEGQQLRAP